MSRARTPVPPDGPPVIHLSGRGALRRRLRRARHREPASTPTASTPDRSQVRGGAPETADLPDRRPSWRRWARRFGRGAVAIGAAAAVGAAVTVGGHALSEGDGPGGGVLGPGVVRVEVGIEMSRFDLGTLRVHEGTLVELVVRNDDPIDHELVVGDAAVHARHEGGAERRHPPVPGEVSVAPGETAMTFYRFDEPGTVAYACHLPGHVAYGMVGEIEVVPAA